MKALILKSSDQPVDYEDVVLRSPLKSEVVVHLQAAALNHRDLWITKGQYAGIRYPIILGSDGAGELDGKPILINPSLDWGRNQKVQGPKFRILGLPDNGTLAEQVIVPRRSVYPKPPHLNWSQAAAIPLAGLTAWRALFSRCQLKKGERVLITGIGGGVALFALQFAVAAGAEVWVTSGSDDKIARAVTLGAKGGVNYRTENWHKQLQAAAKGFDVVIDSAAGDGFAQLVQLCEPAARIGIFGGTTGKINAVVPQMIFWKQISILGSTMGSDREFEQMLAFVTKHEILPVIDTEFALSDGRAALERMNDGAQFGKIVLRTND